MERLTKRYTYNGKPEISVDSEINGISCSNFCTSCGEADCEDIRKALFKLAEYEDLEEQGKLLKLPCAVGDTVYEVQGIRKRIQPYEITFASVDGLGKCFFYWRLKDGQGIYGRVDGFPENYLGIKVFLTREEAEAVLKELEGKEE